MRKTEKMMEKRVREKGEKLKRVKKTHLLWVLNRLPISPNANQLVLFFSFLKTKETSGQNTASFHR